MGERMSRTTGLRILYYVIALLDRSDLPKIGRDLPSATPKNAEDRSDLEFEGIQLPQVCHLLPVLKTEAEPGLAAAYEVARRRRVCLRARANVRPGDLDAAAAGGAHDETPGRRVRAGERQTRPWRALW